MTQDGHNDAGDRSQDPELGYLPLPTSPWVLVDDSTISDTTVLLERLVRWLQTADPKATIDCARALSLGEDDFVDNVETWADALAGRLLACAQGGAA
jgi:hypothetical protein